MLQTTVCFLLKDSPQKEVLLGFKKSGFGSGKYAGIGGRVEAGETIEAAAMREVEEEIGVKIPKGCIQYMGKVTFVFPAKPDWDQDVSVYTAKSWEGEPKESEEMKPFWFKLGDIPYDAMWQDAAYWIPQVLEGSSIQSRISFKEDNESVDEVFQDTLFHS